MRDVFQSPDRDSLSSRLGKRSVDNFIRQVVDKTLVFKPYEDDFDNFISKKTFDNSTSNAQKLIKRNLKLKKESPNFYTPQKFVKDSFKNKIHTINHLPRNNFPERNEVKNPNEQVKRN